MLVLQSAGKYVDWGVFHISVTNLLIIAVMILVFVLAIVLPFPKPRDVRRDEENGT